MPIEDDDAWSTEKWLDQHIAWSDIVWSIIAAIVILVAISSGIYGLIVAFI